MPCMYVMVPYTTAANAIQPSTTVLQSTIEPNTFLCCVCNKILFMTGPYPLQLPIFCMHEKYFSEVLSRLFAGVKKAQAIAL